MLNCSFWLSNRSKAVIRNLDNMPPVVPVARNVNNSVPGPSQTSNPAVRNDFMTLINKINNGTELTMLYRTEETDTENRPLTCTGVSAAMKNLKTAGVKKSGIFFAPPPPPPDFFDYCSSEDMFIPPTADELEKGPDGKPKKPMPPHKHLKPGVSNHGFAIRCPSKCDPNLGFMYPYDYFSLKTGFWECANPDCVKIIAGNLIYETMLNNNFIHVSVHPHTIPDLVNWMEYMEHNVLHPDNWILQKGGERLLRLFWGEMKELCIDEISFQHLTWHASVAKKIATLSPERSLRQGKLKC